ncbi:NEDD8-activating enzyme E1 regulatory subunit [Nymphaea thermarum]|nr:NEDD8-activating enzyme E1 regulatory subunit [Nymphaea thermarum]
MESVPLRQKRNAIVYLGKFTLGKKLEKVNHSLPCLESKVKCVCAFLPELNDAVKAKYVEESPALPENLVVKLDRISRKEDIMLIAAWSYGLAELVRISVKVYRK